MNLEGLNEALKFCLWDKEEELVKEELLSIYFRKETDDTNVKGKRLHKNENGTFYYEITPYGKDFGITDEGVKSSFIIV